MTLFMALIWPGLVMIVLVVQFVTICLLRRKVQRLEEIEYYYYHAQYPQLQQVQPQQVQLQPFQRPLRRRSLKG